MRFYVYELTYAGRSMYVGKGSGRRVEVQKAAFRLDGAIIKEFDREKAAYKFEREAIASLKPVLNRHPGGNGSRAVKRRSPPRSREEMLMTKIGTRAYAARVLLERYPYMIEPDVITQLIPVAYPQTAVI